MRKIRIIWMRLQFLLLRVFPLFRKMERETLSLRDINLKASELEFEGRQREKEVIRLKEEVLTLQANVQGTTQRLQQAQGQILSLEDSQAREVDSLRHMVDWFAVQGTSRQQVFGTLPANSLPAPSQSSASFSRGISAKTLSRQMTEEFLRDAFEQPGQEHFSSASGVKG